MKTHALALTLASVAVLALGACNDKNGNGSGNAAQSAQTPKAQKAAGDKTVLTDSAGHKATITQADQQFSNGVVQQVDGVLMPAKMPAANAPAVGEKAGK